MRLENDELRKLTYRVATGTVLIAAAGMAAWYNYVPGALILPLSCSSILLNWIGWWAHAHKRTKQLYGLDSKREKAEAAERQRQQRLQQETAEKQRQEEQRKQQKATQLAQQQQQANRFSRIRPLPPLTTTREGTLPGDTSEATDLIGSYQDLRTRQQSLYTYQIIFLEPRKKEYLSYKKLKYLAIASVVTYPVVLGFTDYLVPSGSLIADIGKYSLEFVLAGLATSAVAVARSKKPSAKVTQKDIDTITKRISTIEKEIRRRGANI